MQEFGCWQHSKGLRIMAQMTVWPLRPFVWHAEQQQWRSACTNQQLPRAAMGYAKELCARRQAAEVTPKVVGTGQGDATLPLPVTEVLGTATLQTLIRSCIPVRVRTFPLPRQKRALVRRCSDCVKWTIIHSDWRSRVKCRSLCYIFVFVLCALFVCNSVVYICFSVACSYSL